MLNTTSNSMLIREKPVLPAFLVVDAPRYDSDGQRGFVIMSAMKIEY